MPLYTAAAADLLDIADLVNTAYRGDSGQRGWTHEADYIEGPRTDAETLARDMAANPQALLLVYRDEPQTEILGCVWLEPAGDAIWYLGMLSVRPNLQEKRLGRTILGAAETLAAARGARRMRMTVVNIRDTLIAWYQRRGYALTGETQPFPYADDRFGRPHRDDLCFVVLEKAL